MKKKLIFLSMVPPLLVGCSSNGEVTGKIDLLYGALYDTSVTGNGIFHLNRRSNDSGYYYSNYLPYSDLLEMIEDKKSFILVVRAEDEDCACYTGWRSLLSQYMEKYNVEMYLMSQDELSVETSGSTRAESIGLSLKNENFLSLWNSGKLAYQEFAPDGSDFASKYESVETYLNERVNLPKAISLAKEQLDSLYAGNKDFIVYFARSSCGDCQYFETKFLNDYLKNNSPENFYYLDCDEEGVRLYEGYAPGESNEQEIAAASQWNQFKLDYGLAESTANPAGYDVGYVPSLMKVSPDGENKLGDVITSFAVYLNDSYEVNGDTLTITSSYYSKARLEEDPSYLSYLGEMEAIEGRSYSGYDQIQYSLVRSFYREKLASIYSEIITKFFNGN